MEYYNINMLRLSVNCYNNINEMTLVNELARLLTGDYTLCKNGNEHELLHFRNTLVFTGLTFSGN